jgi:hypothetical protein
VGHDAGAVAGERCWGALEHLHVPAAAAEVRCGQQTAHRAPDNERASRVLSHRMSSARRPHRRTALARLGACGPLGQLNWGLVQDSQALGLAAKWPTSIEARRKSRVNPWEGTLG